MKKLRKRGRGRPRLSEKGLAVMLHVRLRPEDVESLAALRARLGGAGMAEAVRYLLQHQHLLPQDAHLYPNPPAMRAAAKRQGRRRS